MQRNLSAITLKVNELRYNIIMTDKDDALAALTVLLACFTAICIFMTIFSIVMAAYDWITGMF